MHWVGIDPGATGGVVVLDHLGGIVAWAPFDRAESPGGVALGVIPLGEVFIALEKVGAAPGQGVTSMFTFGRNVGNITGWLEARGYSYRQVHSLAWATLVRDMPGDSLKERARAFVENRWGMEGFILKGSRKPHKGLIDAACIGEYYRLEFSKVEAKALSPKARKPKRRGIQIG